MHADCQFCRTEESGCPIDLGAVVVALQDGGPGISACGGHTKTIVRLLNASGHYTVDAELAQAVDARP